MNRPCITKNLLLARSFSQIYHPVQRIILHRKHLQQLSFKPSNFLIPCIKCRLLSSESGHHEQHQVRKLQTSVTAEQTTNSIKESFRKNMYKIGITFPENYMKEQLQNAAYVLLNGVYMKVKHTELREQAGLEDSFTKWVHVVYLHLWFLMCRLKREGRDGELLTAYMMKMLWQDLEQRLEKYEEELKQDLKKRSVMRSYFHMLHIFFIYLDEGLLGGDAMLASALWSKIYVENAYEAEIWHLEFLVHYVRFTATWLQEVPMDTLVLQPEAIEWALPV